MVELQAVSFPVLVEPSYMEVIGGNIKADVVTSLWKNRYACRTLCSGSIIFFDMEFVDRVEETARLKVSSIIIPFTLRQISCRLKS